MNNTEVVHYIENKLNCKFNGGFKALKMEVEHQPNNNFFISYSFNGYTVNFIKDRGMIEVEFLYSGNFKMLHEYNNLFLDLVLNHENIDKIINEISTNREHYFK